eukprot:TRINITY_DN747_c0_g1_i1.p1 TRINITY_DN747_c0_g1~~TRINITY_DN747_c0_g1_i1.p1  ORF type:complete len:419 (+),score=31.83 TRINITY_DN747_c0_g1_i1:30-1259(+)
MARSISSKLSQVLLTFVLGCHARQVIREACADARVSPNALSLAQKYATFDLGTKVTEQEKDIMPASEVFDDERMIPVDGKHNASADVSSARKLELIQYHPAHKMNAHWEISQITPSSDDHGDWVFAMHHKSGTTVGALVALQLCTATGRPIYKYTYREKPMPCKRCCHLLIKSFPEDFPSWLALAKSSRYGRLIHIVRNPIEMIVSGYRYHWRGSEIEWTNSSVCSRDTCTLPAAKGKGLDKVEADALFQKENFVQFLKSIGCGRHSTYLECLRGSSVTRGLNVEARRARPTLTAVQTITQLMSTSNQTLSLCGDLMKMDKFNNTIRHLVAWLGVPGTQVPKLSDECYNAVFNGRRSQKMIYSHSATMLRKHKDIAGLLDTDVLEADISQWKKKTKPAWLVRLSKNAAC